MNGRLGHDCADREDALRAFRDEHAAVGKPLRCVAAGACPRSRPVAVVLPFVRKGRLCTRHECCAEGRDEQRGCVRAVAATAAQQRHRQNAGQKSTERGNQDGRIVAGKPLLDAVRECRGDERGAGRLVAGQAAGSYFQIDGQDVGHCVLGNREDQIVAAGSDRPWRCDRVSAIGARASLDAACRGLDLDFGTRNRFVAREPVDVKDELAAACHRDQLEVVGGSLGSRHRSHGDRSGLRAVVMAFVPPRLGTPRRKRQARCEQDVH